MKEYGYDPNAAKSPIPKEICDLLSKYGISRDPKTIRNWLKEGAELIPPIEEKK